MDSLQSTHILGVKVTTASEGKILEYIEHHIKSGHKKLFITTPNPEIIMYARSHPEFRSILNEADLALADGVGVTIGGYFLGKGKMPRVTGTDMVKKLCRETSKKAESVGFFGGRADVAEKTAECLQKKYSGLTVKYADETWDEAKVRGKSIDILFVAMGYPKQEKWIYENLKDIPVKVAIGVGGAFDFISGKTPRAPQFLQNVGLEWLYRLIRQPWRWKRQLALISFTLLVLQEALRTSSKKTS